MAKQLVEKMRKFGSMFGSFFCGLGALQMPLRSLPALSEAVLDGLRPEKP
jgi:hypothetical protein